MEESALTLSLLVVVLLISMPLILVGLRSHGDVGISKTWTLVAGLPSVLSLVLFGSLAVHMRQVLGGWPAGIGFAGFQAPLLFHAQISSCFFWVLIEYSIYIWPLFCIFCAVVPAFRKTLLYAGIYSAGLAVVILVMLTAPSGFQRWWWD